MPSIALPLPPPLHGVDHSINFVRFVEAKRQGFAGSFTDFVGMAPGGAWQVTMPPSANGVENMQRFLWAKQRGYPGSLDTFSREGFSYTVTPGGGPGAPGVPGTAIGGGGRLVADRSGGDLFRTIDMLIDAIAERAILRPASAEIDRALDSATTPTERRDADAPAPTSVSLSELLLAETGPERGRFRVRPQLPAVPKSPEPKEIFHRALTASEARHALAEIMQANNVMKYRIAVGNAALSEWALPEARREADAPADAPAADLASLLLAT